MTSPVHQNPYTAGAAVGGETGFYGRKNVFSEVEQLLKSETENILILHGPRRIGLTSSLLQLQHWLQNKNLGTGFYFDLQGQSQNSLSELLYELAQRLNESVGLAVPDRSQFDDNGEEYFQTGILPQLVSADQKLVLLFDEVDALNSIEREQSVHPFLLHLNRWVKEFQEIEAILGVGYIQGDPSSNLLSVLKSISYSQRVSILSLFSLSYDDTKNIIQISQNDPATMTWDDDAVDQVWNLTRGDPYLTQLLCKVIWNQIYQPDCSETPNVNVEHVHDAVPDTLDKSHNAFESIWKELSTEEQLILSVMSLDYDWSISEKRVEKILGKDTLDQVGETLQKLCRKELLKPVENGYRFFVPLFGRWINETRPTERIIKENKEISSIEQSAIFFAIEKRNNELFYNDIIIRGLPYRSMKPQIDNVSSEEFTKFKNDLREILNDDSIDYNESENIETIEDLGLRLMELVVPGNLKRKIEINLLPKMKPEDVPVMIIENSISDLNIPWELIFHCDKENFFWGEKFIISEIKTNAEDEHKDELHDDFFNEYIIVPESDLKLAFVLDSSLDYAVTEKRLFDCFPGINVIESKNDYETKIKDHTHHIIHVAAHGEVEDNAAYISLSGNEKLNNLTIKKTRCDGNPIIFLHTCNSNPSSRWLGLSIGLADYFLDKVQGPKARTCICTNWEIPEESEIVEFVKKFYTTFLKGNSIGYSLFKAREEMMNIDKHPMWFAYTLRGNPFVKLKGDYTSYVDHITSFQVHDTNED